MMTKKHGFELKLFFSIFSKLTQIELTQIEINKAGVKLQTYVTLEITVILESKVKLDESYMKMSKYENSVFSYSLHSTVHLPAWRTKDTNVNLKSFLRLFTETITPERK